MIAETGVTPLLSSFSHSARADERVNFVLKYINFHLDENLSLEILADKACMSPFHLHKVFTKEVGIPIGSYIQRIRVITAAKIMKLCSLPLSEIKYMVGYHNDAAFSKAFKKVFYTSPQYYRKNTVEFNNKNILPDFWLQINYDILEVSGYLHYSVIKPVDYASKNMYQGWKYLKQNVLESGLSYNQMQYWGVCHDCPDLTGQTLGRYEMILLSDEGINAPNSKKVDFGKYARIRFLGSFDHIISVYRLFHQALKDNEEKPDYTRFGFQRYLNDPAENDPDQFFYEFYLPIQ